MNRPNAALQLSKRWPGSTLIARQFTITILTIIGFSSTALAQASQAESCTIIENVDKTSLNIQYDQLNIVVHGWRHQGMEDINANANKVFDLVRMVNTGAPCDTIQSLLDQELKSKEELYVYSYDLYARLQKTAVKPATVLALESSEEERIAADRNPNIFLKPANIPRLATVFDSLKSRCQSLVTSANKYQLIVMMPTNVFWVEQKNTGKLLKMVGVDDLALRNETAAKIPIEARSYNPEAENYSPEAAKAVRDLHERMHVSAKAPTDKEIQDVLKLIPKADSKKRTELALKGYQILIPLAHKRDVKFVENLINLKTDSVLSVGWAHLRGMKEEFARRCKKVVMKTESIMLRSAGNSAASPSSTSTATPARAAATR